MFPWIFFFGALTSCWGFSKFGRHQSKTEGLRHDEPFAMRNKLLPLSAEKIQNSDNLSFDVDLALALGAHAFDVYNDPSVGEGKKCIGLDDTTITYSSSDFVKRSFQGLLIGTLKKGQFRSVTEGELTESIVSGGDPDAYIKMHIEEDEDPFRILESYTSKVKPNNNMPEWRESFSFYLRGDPSKATLRINAFDKDIFSEDDVIGAGEVPLVQILANARENDKNIVEVPVPVYSNTKRGLFGFGGGRKRKGTVVLELQYIEFSDDERSNRQFSLAQKLRAPKGASPGEANWELLLTDRILEVLSKTNSNGVDTTKCIGETLMLSMGKGLHKVCSMDNSQTDTQASVWADYENRQIVLSFRGTEQIKVKDVLTDINLVQVRFFPGLVKQFDKGEDVGGVNEDALRQVLIHKGFLSAFRSIQPAVLQTLSMLLASDTNDGDKKKEIAWTVHITGHSLGGALASLTTFDLARIAQGYFLDDAYSSISRGDNDRSFFETLFDDNWQDPAVNIIGSSLSGKNSKVTPPSLVQSLRDSTFVTYTYGAPRVGNPRFSQISDAIAPHHYRIVNDKDVVPRVPRSSTANRLLEYSHAGKTVAVATNGTKEAIWIEGQSAGTSPTQEVNPFFDRFDGTGLPSALLSSSSEHNNDSQTTAQEVELFDIEQQLASLLALHPATAKEALSSIADQALTSGQSLLMSALPDVLQAAGVEDQDLEKLDGLFKMARELSGGVQSKFIEREFEMLASILDSRALTHHLEPSYFEALLVQARKKR